MKDAKVRVYIRLPKDSPVHFVHPNPGEKIDFLVMFFEPENCLSKVRVLAAALKPVYIGISFWEGSCQILWDDSSSPKNDALFNALRKL